MRRCDCGSHAINYDPNKKLCDVCLYKVPLFSIFDYMGLSTDENVIYDSYQKAAADLSGRFQYKEKLTLALSSDSIFTFFSVQ